MDERQKDFLKIKKMIGKVTPEQLGSLMRQYYSKHLTPLKKDDTLKDAIAFASENFDGELFSSLTKS